MQSAHIRSVYHLMVIDDLDIFYPPYPSQLVVDVNQNVKYVFGVCIFCPHFYTKILTNEAMPISSVLSIFLHSAHV
jgi:hypothetical protein